MTTTAESCARHELGLTRGGILRCVLQLRSSDFYKTMEAEQFPGRFQDVYRPVMKTPMHQGGVGIYCKVQIVEARAVVISFKRL